MVFSSTGGTLFCVSSLPRRGFDESTTQKPIVSNRWSFFSKNYIADSSASDEKENWYCTSNTSGKMHSPGAFFIYLLQSSLFPKLEHDIKFKRTPICSLAITRVQLIPRFNIWPKGNTVPIQNNFAGFFEQFNYASNFACFPHFSTITYIPVLRTQWFIWRHFFPNKL